VLAHNVETVPRIFKRIRPAFRYERSLDVLTQARDVGLVTKSNLILGMGETARGLAGAARPARRRLRAGHDHAVPAPDAAHHPVERWVKPEEFVELKVEAEQIGFAGVMSGPLVRSSYRAGRSTSRPSRPARRSPDPGILTAWRRTGRRRPAARPTPRPVAPARLRR
jgi:lipoic acid synthetase